MPEEDLLGDADQQLVHVVLQPGTRLDELGAVGAGQILALCNSLYDLKLQPTNNWSLLRSSTEIVSKNLPLHDACVEERAFARCLRRRTCLCTVLVPMLCLCTVFVSLLCLSTVLVSMNMDTVGESQLLTMFNWVNI